MSALSVSHMGFRLSTGIWRNRVLPLTGPESPMAKPSEGARCLHGQSSTVGAEGGLGSGQKEVPVGQRLSLRALCYCWIGSHQQCPAGWL